jgi:cell envelope opacity-associated protein A
MEVSKMRKLFFCLIVITAFSAFALAQTNEPYQPANPSATSPDMKSAPAAASTRGTVESVDLTGKSLTIRDESTSKTKVYTFSDMTTFSKMDKPLNPTDLKKGDHVTFSANDSGQLTSLNVESKESKQ